MVIHKDLQLKIVEPSEASIFLGQFVDANWRQQPSYTECAARQIGAISEYAVITRKGEPVGMANVRLKKLPFLPFGIAFVSHGPLWLRSEGTSNSKGITAILQALSSEYVEQRGYCLRIETPVCHHGILSELRDQYAQAGFQQSKRKEYQTFVVDLCPDLHQLRKNLNGKWRTDLNRGERGDLRITRSNDPEDFKRFAPLLRELSGDKGFSIAQDSDFFANVASRSRDNESIIVHLAWDGTELVSGHIGAFSGDMAVYLLGATNARGRHLRASYVLQWQVMVYAKSLGLNHYDLGGIDETENPAVHRFKKRMGGEYVRNHGVFELYSGLGSKFLIRLAERVYNLLKGGLA